MVFFMRNAWQSVKELRDSDINITNKVHEIDTLVAGSYLKRDEWASHMSELFKKLDRIEDKLDQKVDK